jgi:hypothetical protein
VVPVPRRDLLFQHRFDAGYSHAALLAQRAKQSAGEPAIKPLLIGLRQLFLLLHVRVSRSFDGGNNFATGNQCKATNIGTPSWTFLPGWRIAKIPFHVFAVAATAAQSEWMAVALPPHQKTSRWAQRISTLSRVLSSSVSINPERLGDSVWRLAPLCSLRDLLASAEDRAEARTQRRSSAKWRCGVRNMPKFVKLTEQSN